MDDNGNDKDRQAEPENAAANDDVDAAAPVAPESDDPVARLNRELEEAREECRRKDDRLLRERAELENVKKRLQREKAESLRFACEGLVRDLLPVFDELELALAHAGGSDSSGALGDGVALVLKRALQVLETHGVQRIEAQGQPFDPHEHEALVQVEAPDRPANQVVEQFRAGYRLHDRLLRAAQVSVSRVPAESSEKTVEAAEGREQDVEKEGDRD
jgi:molecular chaperone GrpE